MAVVAVLSVARYGAELLGFRASDPRGDGTRAAVFPRLDDVTSRTLRALLNVSRLTQPSRVAASAELGILSHAAHARRLAVGLVGKAHTSATWLALLVAAYRGRGAPPTAPLADRRRDPLALYVDSARRWTALQFPLRGSRRPVFAEIREIVDVARRARAVGRLSALRELAAAGAGQGASRYCARGFVDTRDFPRLRETGVAVAATAALSRGRLNATLTASRLGQLPPEARARCPACGALGPDSVAHLLVDCAAYEPQRADWGLRALATAAVAALVGHVPALPPCVPSAFNQAVLLLGGEVGGRRLPRWKGRDVGPPSRAPAAAAPAPPVGPHLPPCQVVGRFLAAVEPLHGARVMALFAQDPGFGPPLDAGADAGADADADDDAAEPPPGGAVPRGPEAAAGGLAPPSAGPGDSAAPPGGAAGPEAASAGAGGSPRAASPRRSARLAAAARDA